MYYILNETNQIIAADDSLLSFCGVKHIDELSSKIFKGDATFNLESNERIIVSIKEDEKKFTISKTHLSSMLGHLTLINLLTENEEVDSFSSTENDDITFNLSSEDSLDELLDFEIEDEKVATENIDNTLSNDLDINKAKVETALDLDVDDKDQNITFENHLILDDDIMSLKDEEKDIKTEDSIKENIIIESNAIDDSELFNLVLDDEASSENKNLEESIPLELNDNSLSSFELTEHDDVIFDTEKTTDISEIVVDIEKISHKIGISTDDYNNFLNEFIDTALSLEKNLQNSDEEKRSHAIDTLSHLSDVLHLPVIGDIIDDIAKNKDHRKSIESFYRALSLLTTSKTNIREDLFVEKEEILFEDIPSITEEVDDVLDIIDKPDDVPTITNNKEPLELFDELETVSKPINQKKIKLRKTTNNSTFGTISLEGIKPIHFDFQLEEAANDLSLPVELIEEFVHDFIDQAHIETKKILEAYEDGDLDTIQKIGHLLKGASSNLRINPLSDTLYKIQFCENSSDLEALIKDYWAHFLSFENQINVISN